MAIIGPLEAGDRFFGKRAGGCGVHDGYQLFHRATPIRKASPSVGVFG